MAAARKTTGVRPDAAVVFYIATEVFRRYYDDADAVLAGKLRRNIRRSHQVTIDAAVVLRLVQHYAKAYDVAASVLPRFIGPTTGKYVDANDIRLDAFRAALRKRYPREPKLVLKALEWYTVHYEYLR